MSKHFVANVTRSLSNMFPGYFRENAKHDHNRDFGYPDTLTFDHFHAKYTRNGLATSAVNRTALKTWETFPVIKETEEDDDDGNARVQETRLEREIRRHFTRIRLWPQIVETDKRSMVGAYAGLILRLADNRRFSEPVDSVPGGLDGLVEVIPAWEGQLKVSHWDHDETSETYGKPLLFEFNESQVQTNHEVVQRNRQFNVHPDRVVIWSLDGTVHNRSMLSPGFNVLHDMEKITGAGGEGFWRNAKGAPVFQTDPEINLENMAKGMGVGTEELADKMDKQVSDWLKGFDSMLMLQGIEAKTLGVTLPVPEHFFNVALQVFAASVPIPQKILTGMQTGERASTEDSNEWARTNTARRINMVVPLIMEFLGRLEAFGMIPERDWSLKWESLTEDGMDQKINRAFKMAEVNSKSPDEEVFTVDEMRDAVGLPPIDFTEDDEEDNDQ